MRSSEDDAKACRARIAAITARKEATELVQGLRIRIARHLANGCKWHDEPIRKLRIELAAASTDRAVLRDLIDGIDSITDWSSPSEPNTSTQVVGQAVKAHRSPR